MKLRFSKINWILRPSQFDVKPKVISTHQQQQQIIKRFYSEDGATTAAVADGAAQPPLFDLHGRRHNYLRISLTERCNLRCRYCMPAEGVPLTARAALLSRLELARLVRVLAALGVDKVRLTGGEPTLRADLADVVRELAAVPGLRRVALTTNGLVLTRRLPALQRAGLTHLNVSLDSLRADRYEAVARRPGLPRVLAGVDLALQLGYRPKLNVVLIKGFNDDEIGDFVDYTRDRDLDVRFIEFMPFGGNRWAEAQLVPHAAALAAARARHELAREPAARHDTAQVWRAAGHRGRVGFISSLTQPFCGGCNRLRLTADGNLKVCLFGNAEVSLRDAMRAGADDAELRRLVRAALHRKRPQHAGGRSVAAARLTRSPLGRHAAAGAAGQPAHDPHRRLAARGLCSLPHLDAQGAARIVDVGGKAVTRRAAEAECWVRASERVLRALRGGTVPKGDALGVARVAGALGAKRAASLLPLCHPLALDAARVRVDVPAGAGAVRVRCAVRVTARTGAEMEALTGAAVAALALYDMCKALDRDMRITDLRLLTKSGGRSGDWPPPSPAPPSSPPGPPSSPPAPPSTPPAPPASEAGETYAPTNFMHF